LLDKEIKMVPTKEDTHADTDDTDIDTRIVQVSYCLCILPAEGSFATYLQRVMRW
jgi:hypothetical protein